MNWKQKIEAQIATIDRFPNYLPSGLHTSEITALLRQLLDVAVAAGAMREDYERYGYVRNKGYVNPLHDEKILRAYDDALDKLREVE